VAMLYFYISYKEKNYHFLLRSFQTRNGIITNPAFSQKANKEENNTGKTGTITDSRDGKTYKTVKIGEQRWISGRVIFVLNKK
jgi:hypothetical protein